MRCGVQVSLWVRNPTRDQAPYSAYVDLDTRLKIPYTKINCVRWTWILFEVQKTSIASRETADTLWQWTWCNVHESASRETVDPSSVSKYLWFNMGIRFQLFHDESFSFQIKVFKRRNKSPSGTGVYISPNISSFLIIILP